MKRVFLTGASGFIGRHCIPFLLKKGYEVFAVYQNASPMQEEGIQWVKIDLLDQLQVKDALDKIQPTHLLHLAWYVAHGKFWSSSANFEWIKASLTLIENFAHGSGKRVVMTGTCFEYDLSYSFLSEQETPLKPATLYGGSKLSLSIALDSFAKQNGLSAAWGRIFFLYGPHENPQRFIPSIIRGLLRKEAVPCTHCQQVRDFLHVQDVAEALVELLDSSIEGSVNIASGEGISLKTIIENIEDHLKVKGLAQFGALQPQAFEPTHLIGSTTRLNEELKWHPRYSLKEGIYKTIEWWEPRLQQSLLERNNA
jgi:nucleoside-diphosphate-sugar epimerase